MRALAATNNNMGHYYNRVNTNRGGCPKPSRGVRIIPGGRKRRKFSFSIQRFRVKVLTLFRILKRWRWSLCPYKRTLTRKSSKSGSEEFRWRSGSSSSSSSLSTCHVGSGNCSFYSDAIADCLEFIKRNSISVDENRDRISLSDVC